METHPTDVGGSLDSAFEVLGHSYRRHAVRVLDAHGSELALADLADETAVREFDARLPEIASERVRSVYLSLYHNHVPRLSAADVVEYEQEDDIVAPTESVSELADVLDTLQ